MSRALSLIVLAWAGLAQGCTWTYLEYPSGVGPFGPAKFVVSAGNDTGPEADRPPFVHPQLIELALEQPESGLANYYTVVLRRAAGGDALAKGDLNALLGAFKQVAHADEAQAFVAVLQQGWDDEQAKLAARGLARAVGHYVAPAVITSIADHGYGRISWGYKTDEGNSGLKLAGNGVYVTVNLATMELKVHGTEAHTTFALPWVGIFSLAAADPEWILEPRDKAGNLLTITDYEQDCARVCGDVRKLREEDLASVSRIN